MTDALPRQSQDAAFVATSTPVNFRDLGGLPVEGGTIRTGLVFRSDDICLVPDEWAKQVVETPGITAILDLRSESEVRVTGRGPLGGLPVSYHHYAFGGDVVVEGAASIATPEALSQWYVQLMEASAPLIVSALAVIAAERGATVFHCSAGKDRTGILAASLLSVLGASSDTIITDYARTSDVLDQVIGRLASAHGIDPTDSRIRGFLRQEPRPPVLTADAPVMAETLRLVADKHGSVLDLLQHSGLTPAHLDELREKLVH